MVMRLGLHGDCSRGVDLVRAEYVPDDEADIGSTVLRLKERVGPGGFVFTSGGIGATHDDVTYSAIAAAFGAPAAQASAMLLRHSLRAHYCVLLPSTFMPPEMQASGGMFLMRRLVGKAHSHGMLGEEAPAKCAALQAQSCSCMSPRWSACARTTASAALSSTRPGCGWPPCLLLLR